MSYKLPIGGDRYLTILLANETQTKIQSAISGLNSKLSGSISSGLQSLRTELEQLKGENKSSLSKSSKDLNDKLKDTVEGIDRLENMLPLIVDELFSNKLELILQRKQQEIETTIKEHVDIRLEEIMQNNHGDGNGNKH